MRLEREKKGLGAVKLGLWEEEEKKDCQRTAKIVKKRAIVRALYILGARTGFSGNHFQSE